VLRLAVDHRPLLTRWSSRWGFQVRRTARFVPAPYGHERSVFLLFSSRLGCLGSLLVSVVLTLVVLAMLHVL
jgi:hypothetical protein